MDKRKRCRILTCCHDFSEDDDSTVTLEVLHELAVDCSHGPAQDRGAGGKRGPGLLVEPSTVPFALVLPANASAKAAALSGK